MFSKGLRGYLPATLLQGIGGFATLMVFTRVLTPDDYGRYVLAMGISTLTSTILFTWLISALARFYPAERLDDPKAPVLYGTIYRIFWALALLLLVVDLGLMAFWSSASASELALKHAIGLGLASAIPVAFLMLVQEQRRSEGRVSEASVISMLQTAGGFGFGLTFVLIGVTAASPLLGAGVVAACLLPFVAREDWGRAVHGSFNRVAAGKYAHYGFPITISLVLTLALYNVDRFMIAHYLGEADAGAYHAGFSIASRIIDVLFIWFGTAGVPALVNVLETEGHDALCREAGNQILLIALVTFPAVAGIISIAGPLSQILIGKDLRGPALSITPIVTMGALMAGLNNGYFLLPFSLTKRTRLLIVAMGIPALLNIVFNLLLIPRWGLRGAAIAYATSFFIGILTSWALSGRSLRLPVPVRELGKIALASAVMAAVVIQLPRFGLTLDLLLKPVIGAVVYATLAYILNLANSRHRAQGIWERRYA